MAQVIIEDFQRGLDRRKMLVSSVPGSLTTCTNAHITRGGEIEKRRAFVPRYALPPGQTYGLEASAGTIYTFGSDASPAVPPGVVYQRLEHGSAADMIGVNVSELYDGKVFAVAEYGNGDTLHFFNGAQVADFTAGSGADVAGKALTSLLTFGSKMYGTAESVLFFSVIADAATWKDGEEAPPVGSGFKNMANQSAGSETLTALGKYQNLMAVFARRNIQLWDIKEDDSLNVQRQVLSNIGTYAPRSVVAFGEIDTFFLADTGVRSLRARENSDRAGVADVGTAIDEELEPWLATLTAAQRARAVAEIEPRSGRYMLAVGERCYVFSHFPSERIMAWSRYEPGFAISDMASDGGRLWVRAGDNLYVYGGESGQEYDSSPVEVAIPFLDMRSIATFKHFKGIDVVCEGEWRIYAATDPDQPEAESHICTITGTTIGEPGIAMNGYGPVIRLRLVNEAPGPARISKIIIHYDPADSG